MAERSCPTRISLEVLRSAAHAEHPLPPPVDHHAVGKLGPDSREDPVSVIRTKSRHGAHLTTVPVEAFRLRCAQVSCVEAQRSDDEVLTSVQELTDGVQVAGV